MRGGDLTVTSPIQGSGGRTPVRLDQPQMLEILRATGNLFVGDDMLQPDEGESINHLRCVDQLVDIKLPDGPSVAEGDGPLM